MTTVVPPVEGPLLGFKLEMNGALEDQGGGSCEIGEPQGGMQCASTSVMAPIHSRKPPAAGPPIASPAAGLLASPSEARNRDLLLGYLILRSRAALGQVTPPPTRASALKSVQNPALYGSTCSVTAFLQTIV